MIQSDIQRAERIDRLRARLAPFLGLAVLSANQWLFFSRDWADVSVAQLALWAAMVLLVLALVLTGGIWFVPRAVRELANDEVTRSSRMAAIQGGFAAAMLTALVVFVVAPFEPLPAQRAAHIIISVALGVALVTYGFAESRHLD